MRPLAAALAPWLVCPLGPALADGPLPLPAFERIVIDDDFPGGYQVEIADVNGDGRPDVVALGGGTCAWYENPSWRKRIITGPDATPGIISGASIDLTGDGKAEVAIAYDFVMNDPSRGELALAIQGGSPDDPWTLRHLGHFGSIHRVRWADLHEDGRPDLIVAPIFGPSARPPSYDQSPAEVVALETTTPAGTPAADWRWSRLVLASRPVVHAIAVDPPRPDRTGVMGDPVTAILTADNLGVSSIGFDVHPRNIRKPALLDRRLYPGAEGPAPDRGSSEVHPIRLREGSSFHPMMGPSAGGTSRFVATIEPWHGNEVVIWSRAFSPEGREVVAERLVLDDTLDQGHALCVADVNGDGIDELFAGHRGAGHRVSAYHFDGAEWSRTILDPGIAAQDLRAGDLTGDGRPDVVAIGGSTHNIVWYRPIITDADPPDLP